jgi:hypothetical protein
MSKYFQSLKIIAKAVKKSISTKDRNKEMCIYRTYVIRWIAIEVNLRELI